MTKLINELHNTKKQIDECLKQSIPFVFSRHNEVIEAIHYSFLGSGKALRPFLVYTISNLLNLEKKTSNHIALAIEMIHTYSLIHDDLPAMDNDVLRRGKPTCHIQFSESTAILAGDALLTKAFEILAKDETLIPADIRCKLILLLAQNAGINGMVGGQVMDLSAEKTPLSEQEIYQMQSMKTGALLKFSCLAPAIAAQASEEIISSLEIYAKNIGLMFQITDDLLDENGDEKTVGKTLKKDKSANKSTFISLYSKEKVSNLLNELHQTAVKAINIYPLNQNSLLSDLANFILTRRH